MARTARRDGGVDGGVGGRRDRRRKGRGPGRDVPRYVRRQARRRLDLAAARTRTRGASASTGWRCAFSRATCGGRPTTRRTSCSAPPPIRRRSRCEITAAVENKPTGQWEQVDLCWYYDDGHMVKLGQELVDGQLSVVMGREQADRTQTVAIIPLDSHRVELRLTVDGKRIKGRFKTPDDDWKDAGRVRAARGAGGQAAAGQPPVLHGPAGRRALGAGVGGDDQVG